MRTRRPNEAISEAVRRRIVMHSGGDVLVLHEGKIAEEFGVSRTPVRQVLQLLASEWLVEVRSGVGSIATPLRAEDRDRDFGSLAAILKAGADFASDSDLGSPSIELTAIVEHLKKSPNKSGGAYFESVSRIILCLSDMIEDPILKSAVVSCFWRFVRWRISDNRGDLEWAKKDLIRIASDALSGLELGGAGDAMRMIAVSIEEFSLKKS